MAAEQQVPSSESTNHWVFAIAASAGGLTVIRQILGDLPHDFPGAILVTQHTAASARPSMLTNLLARSSRVSCVTAAHGTAIKPGCVYVALPDRHLLVHNGHIHLSSGPRENHCRPAADPMMRSVAATYGGQAVGIVLTGYLDDGSSGLIAIKRCGGKTIVQDPDEAEVPDMPSNALTYCSVDHILPAAEIADCMVQLTTLAADPSIPPDDLLLTEIQFAERFSSDIPGENRLGELAPYMCPACNGQLWESQVDAVPRYRCHVGHSYTLRSLIQSQAESVERTAWATLRSMEEQVNSLVSLMIHERGLGRAKMADYMQRRIRDLRRRIELVRDSFQAEPRTPDIDLGETDVA